MRHSTLSYVETPRVRRLPRKGDLIGGKYRVERTLGVGGMGIVVEATHVGLNRRVAVKVMLPDFAASSSLVARFQREGRAAAALRSEHAARVMAAGEDLDGSLYLVMELLAGEDLDAVVRQRGPLAVPDAVGYLLQACDAIAEAHALGIIHRDLKPSNLFLVGAPQGTAAIKVLDFGISKFTKLNTPDAELALTGTGMTLGSPLFASPEQLRSARCVDARSDIWSLGVILHRVLTACSPFEAATIGEHLIKLVSTPPTPLRAHRPDAPAGLEAVILRCLEKERGARFQDVGELALALAPFAPAWARELVPRIVGRLPAIAPSAPVRRAGRMARFLSTVFSPRRGSEPSMVPAPERASGSVMSGSVMTRARGPRQSAVATAMAAAFTLGMAGVQLARHPSVVGMAKAPSAEQSERAERGGVMPADPGGAGEASVAHYVRRAPAVDHGAEVVPVVMHQIPAP